MRDKHNAGIKEMYATGISGRSKLLQSCNRVGQGGSGIPEYPKKIRQNTQNSSKYTQNNQSMKGRYTLYLKFKDSDIPNTRI